MDGKKKKKAPWDMDNLSDDFSEGNRGMNWWEHPSVIYAFNLPRVSAQMERLMGSNIVRLTDRKYMIDLRRRIYEVFDENLAKRIEKREYDESEREKRLILNGLYKPENCPDRLVCVHSIALASEMERKTDLILNGICPSEYRKHPVFVNNKLTNKTILNRRAKLKTERERLAEKLLKRGEKWEKERLVVAELDRQREEEIRSRRLKIQNREFEYYQSNKERGLDLLRIHSKEYTASETDLKNYLEMKRAKRNARNKSVQQSKEKHRTKEICVLSPKSPAGADDLSAISPTTVGSHTSIVSSKSTASKSKESTPAESSTIERLSPTTVDGPNSKISPTSTPAKSRESTPIESSTGEQLSPTSKSKENTPTESSTGEQLSPSSKSTSPKKSPTNKSGSDKFQDEKQYITDGYMLSEADFRKMQYKDPQTVQLWNTNNVKEMYELAEQIINGQYKLDTNRKIKGENEQEEDGSEEQEEVKDNENKI